MSSVTKANADLTNTITSLRASHVNAAADLGAIPNHNLRVKFRRASLSDAQAIADLITEVAQQVILPEFSAQGRTQFMLSNNAPAILQFMQDGFCYWVAEYDEFDLIDPVPQPHAQPSLALTRPSVRLCGVLGMKNQQHLYHLFVAVSMQRQGIARRLWQHAKAHSLALQRVAKQAIASTTPSVTTALPISPVLPITVNSSLYAVTVYQRWGFVATASPQTINGVIFVPMQWMAASDDELSSSGI